MQQRVKIVRDPEDIKVCIEKTRRKVLSLLSVKNMTISQLSEALGKDQSTLYRHMKKLRDAGFVEVVDERKEYHIPEKIYGRTAKELYLVPEETNIDEENLEIGLQKENVRRALKILDSMGHENDQSEELVEKCTQCLFKLDEKVSSVFEESDEMEEVVDPYAMKVVDRLLPLLEEETNPEVSELKEDLKEYIDI